MSDGSRLGGRGRQAAKPVTQLDTLHVWTIPTMTRALASSRRNPWKSVTPKDQARREYIGDFPVDGDKASLDRAFADSEALVEAAIEFDPKLARRAQWLRADEGTHCDSGLLAEGDDQPFYRRTCRSFKDEAASGEPIRIVISTDDNQVAPGTAAAFIATARLVQQFRPLEVWWQGSWLSEDRYRGFVFHVPLVMGDMDYSRLEFCIANPRRDSFSFRVMIAAALLDYKHSNSGCGYRANRSYLEGVGWRHFVSHTGIDPSGSSVGCTAARWLGWNDQYDDRYNLSLAAESAAQSLPYQTTPGPELNEAQKRIAERERIKDRERWDRQERERERQAKLEAGRRMQGAL